MSQQKRLTQYPQRIQGTDGIRRELRLSSEFPQLSPQQVFIEKGFITEKFMEIYSYAQVSSLIRKKKVKTGEAFVIGWDPRDPSKKFTDAVIKGVRKAGADAIVIGIVPTPLVPMFMLNKNAAGAFMVTASHNPKNQNGIKTFLRHRGMKLLPGNDIELTDEIFAVDSLLKHPLIGQVKNYRDEALDLFSTFSLSVDGLELASRFFKNIYLVVDPAKGSLSHIAADIFRKAGFGKVVEVNNELDGNVNQNSGVADLEGHKYITRDMVEKGGVFSKHAAILKIFELGSKHLDLITKGDIKLSGAVFDADGDRFYRLEYHPSRDRLLVMSGDETAFLQAKYLKSHFRGPFTAYYINTVESDLNTGLAAEKLGFKRRLTAVGDKWILLQVAFIICENRLKALKKWIGRNSPPQLQEDLKGCELEFKSLTKSDNFDVDRFEALENQLDRLENANSDGDSSLIDIPSIIGSEETGHNITSGSMSIEKSDQQIPVFFGNGLKSALDTFIATQHIFQNKTPRQYYAHLERPYTPGFKGTFYVYYIDQLKFANKTPLWKSVKRQIEESGKKSGFSSKVLVFKEDPDMLYLSLTTVKGERPAGIFVRNSGTENKISVNLRGNTKDTRALKAVGEDVVRLLFQEIKDPEHHLFSHEKKLLEKIKAGLLDFTKLDDDTDNHVFREIQKQGLVELTAKGARLSQRGKWYVSISK